MSTFLPGSQFAKPRIVRSRTSACASGVLEKGGRGEAKIPMAAKDAVLITPYRDGPLLLRGAFTLVDPQGGPIESKRNTVALCRCGKSRMRPFCDGTHKLIGFTASPASEDVS
jgi:CDGSH-type Zn-finger protein